MRSCSRARNCSSRLACSGLTSLIELMTLGSSPSWKLFSVSTHLQEPCAVLYRPRQIPRRPGEVIMSIHAATAPGWSVGWIKLVEGDPTSSSGRQPSRSKIPSSMDVITPATSRVICTVGHPPMTSSDATLNSSPFDTSRPPWLAKRRDAVRYLISRFPQSRMNHRYTLGLERGALFTFRERSPSKRLIGNQSAPICENSRTNRQLLSRVSGDDRRHDRNELPPRRVVTGQASQQIPGDTSGPS